jgi:hypothetical protein
MTMNVELTRILHTLDASVEAYDMRHSPADYQSSEKEAITEERYEISFGLPGYQLKHQFSKDMLQL